MPDTKFPTKQVAFGSYSMKGYCVALWNKPGTSSGWFCVLAMPRIGIGLNGFWNISNQIKLKETLGTCTRKPRQPEIPFLEPVKQIFWDWMHARVNNVLFDLAHWLWFR